MSEPLAETHTVRCDADDCPCWLDGERSARRDLRDSKADLIERLRSTLRTLEAEDE